MSAQADFEQLKRQFVDPIQHDYEAIRPVVLLAFQKNPGNFWR
jgi:hypothetical protein